jgi:hypothetical protein
MHAQSLTIRRIGVAAFLAVCLALPAWVWAAPPSSNPGQPFAEILAQIAILNDKLNDLLAKEDVDLRGVTQNWDKKLDSTNGEEANGCNSDRFTCLFGDTVVRDNETGLVWDRSPEANTQASWQRAIDHCVEREVDGQKGFHLPMIEQLTSLAPLVATDLNSGPFSNVQSADYWSASSRAGIPVSAWVVNFSGGILFSSGKGIDNKHAWCVRGGQAYDGQDVQDVIDALSAP